MIGSFLPKEVKFFELFGQAASLMVEAAKALEKMMDDIEHAEHHSSIIKDIEHRCDQVTHQTMALLHQTFITPLDREDIHQLISKLDDVVDFIDAVAGRLHLYDVRVITPEMKNLAVTSRQSVELIAKIIVTLDKIKKPEEILASCVEINRLENEADRILRSAMAKLFREEMDAREIIKKKEIYQMLETITDRCEDVANVIESIVMEYS